MRIAILSDVHANVEALDRVEAALQRLAPDRVLCLGDVVGYGASPDECCERVRRIASVVVPQLAFLVPGYIFLEATLAIFGVIGPLPTWGSLIYQSLREAPLQDNYFWIAEPIALLVLTGALLGLFPHLLTGPVAAVILPLATLGQ